jgi:hypothetical protein
VNWHQRQSEAAAILRQCRRALAAAGSSIVREVTGGEAADAAAWRHYPDGEVYDPANHAQYFYHRHPAPAGMRATPPEHGHFHLFLRAEGIPTDITPLLLPELAVANVPLPRQSAPLKRGGRDEVCHLVAVAIDESGEPIRLFTTNRWVTGETWYRADDVIRMLDRFRLGGNSPSALVSRWLGALVRLFEPEIAGLLRDRDAAILGRRWRWRGNVFEDARLEIASSLDIDLNARLAAVEQGGNGPALAPAAGSERRLPRMAEGWGT